MSLTSDLVTIASTASPRHCKWSQNISTMLRSRDYMFQFRWHWPVYGRHLIRGNDPPSSVSPWLYNNNPVCLPISPPPHIPLLLLCGVPRAQWQRGLMWAHVACEPTLHCTSMCRQESGSMGAHCSSCLPLFWLNTYYRKQKHSRDQIISGMRGCGRLSLPLQPFSTLR